MSVISTWLEKSDHTCHLIEFSMQSRTTPTKESVGGSPSLNILQLDDLANRIRGGRYKFQAEEGTESGLVAC